jgi:hypothetical protein
MEDKMVIEIKMYVKKIMGYARAVTKKMKKQNFQS